MSAMKLGIGYGKAALQPHDESWHEAAQEMIETLKAILKDTARDIQHVGSTAIRGIPAKPVLDIAVGVDDVHCVYDFTDALLEKGIRIVGEVNPGQIMCDQITENGLDTMHIHFVVYNSEPWKNYICFRDYMNTFPEEAARYGALKTELLAKYHNDRPRYTAGKEPFIREMLGKARHWAQGRE